MVLKMESFSFWQHKQKLIKGHTCYPHHRHTFLCVCIHPYGWSQLNTEYVVLSFIVKKTWVQQILTTESENLANTREIGMTCLGKVTRTWIVDIFLSSLTILLYVCKLSLVCFHNRNIKFETSLLFLFSYTVRYKLSICINRKHVGNIGDRSHWILIWYTSSIL